MHTSSKPTFYKVDETISCASVVIDGQIQEVELAFTSFSAVDVKDGVRGTDQGGHIIGARFFGPGEQINYYPQSANLNQGAWRDMEDIWARAMTEGGDVKVEIRPFFESAYPRPDAFEVDYWIDGVKESEFFENL